MDRFSRPVAFSNRNDEDLHGIWNFEHQNATLWITSGTTQYLSKPFADSIGFEPAEGNISISGTIDGNMNYMYILKSNPYYDGVQIWLGNNPF